MPTGDPVIRTIAMPADTNPSGDIFGSWIMSQMDLAAGSAAARISPGRCATVAVEGMSFHEPVKVGDELTVLARLIKHGRSSITFDVQAWRRPRDREIQTCVIRAHFTFVALDDNGRPMPLPDSAEGETWV